MDRKFYLLQSIDYYMLQSNSNTYSVQVSTRIKVLCILQHFFPSSRTKVPRHWLITLLMLPSKQYFWNPPCQLLRKAMSRLEPAPFWRFWFVFCWICYYKGVSLCRDCTVATSGQKCVHYFKVCHCSFSNSPLLVFKNGETLLQNSCRHTVRHWGWNRTDNSDYKD